MDSILEVQKGLPPGLWLPTPDEPTEQYLSENFNRPDLMHEDLIDYCALVVSFIVREREKTKRVSMMPKSPDFDEMYEAGYGLSLKTLRQRHKMGVNESARSLGFYPRDYTPSPDQLIQRFGWVAAHAYALDPLDTEEPSIKDIMAWGSARNLTPAPEKTYRILDGNTTVLRKMFDIEKRDHHRQYTYLDLYRFGARVIHENGGPVNVNVLNEKYSDVFVSTPRQIITAWFGTMNQFWLEFDQRPPTSRGLSNQDLRNLGVRRAIIEGRVSINIEYLKRSSELLIPPSLGLVNDSFGGTVAYRKKVEEDYEAYLRLGAEFSELGVSWAVFQAVCRLFEATTDFETKLRDSIEPLQKLSANSQAAHYVTRIMRHGFNLLDEHIMDMQFTDFVNCLKRLSISEEAELRFIFDVVPRFNTVEALAQIKGKP